MRPPSTLPPVQKGSLESPSRRWLQGALLGHHYIDKGERVMSVRARINGREFTLSWEEFEKALMKSDLSGGEFEVLAIISGVKPY